MVDLDPRDALFNPQPVRLARGHAPSALRGAGQRHCARGPLRTWSRKLVKPTPAGSALSFDAMLLSIGSSCTAPSVVNTVLMPEARSNDMDLIAGVCPVLEPTTQERGSGLMLRHAAREAHSSCFTSMAVRRSTDASGLILAGSARASFDSPLNAPMSGSDDGSGSTSVEPRMRLQPARLVFIDETAVNTKMTRLRGRSRRGQRLRASAPLAAGAPRPSSLRSGVMGSPPLGWWMARWTARHSTPMSRPSFAPTLRPGDVVIADNLSVHKSARATTALKARGTLKLCFLPAILA